MGGELNCTPGDVVAANADIAGNGVLAAFLLSALLTLGAVVFGYFSESLPEGYLNEIDKALIDEIQFKYLLDLLRSKVADLRNKIRTLLGRQQTPKRRKLSRKERQEALTRFILALSDQQLVTGFAVLVGAIANQRTLTNYDFRVTFGLAWFSATTHLATLDVLRDYFITHETVRKWRICGMVSVLILLLYCYFMITIINQHDTVPIQCVFQSSGQNSTMDYVTFFNPLDLIAIILTVIILLTGYGTRIRWSQGKKEAEASNFLDGQIFQLRAHMLRLPQLSRIGVPERALLLREFKAADKSSRKRRLLERARTRRDSFYLATIDNAMEVYKGSFLSLAPPLMFMLSYGFANLVFTRWMNDTPVNVDNRMGFGQITPICFLTLPMLAAAETYYEAKTVETTDSTPNEPSSPTTADLLYGPNRSDTIPITLPTEDPDSEYLNQRGRDYDDLIYSIKIFFHTEANIVQKEWSSANTAAELVPILRMKDTLLKDYNILQEFERSLPVSSVICAVFVTSSLICIAMGFLLNVPNNIMAWTAASVLVLIYYISSIFDLFYYPYSLAQAMNKESLIRIYEDIRRDATARDDESSQISANSSTKATILPTSRSSQPGSSAVQDDIPMHPLRQRTV